MRFKLVAAVIMACLPVAAFCQEFRGAISGAITDAAGAAIPGVAITAIETRTGAKTTTVSDAAGQYTIPFLAPGEYEIEMRAAGFKAFVRHGIELASSDHLVIDVRLEV